MVEGRRVGKIVIEDPFSRERVLIMRLLVSYFGSASREVVSV